MGGGGAVKVDKWEKGLSDFDLGNKRGSGSGKIRNSVALGYWIAFV